MITTEKTIRLMSQALLQGKEFSWSWIQGIILSITYLEKEALLPM
jgi:hypothetical protein